MPKDKQPELEGIDWKSLRDPSAKKPKQPKEPKPTPSKSLFKVHGDGVQAPLWATAGELTGPHGVADYVDRRMRDGETGNELAERKIKESKKEKFDSEGKSLYESIKEHGVKAPVSVTFASDGNAVLAGGHHRLFSAWHADKNMMIPLRYTDTIERNTNGDCPACQGVGSKEVHALVSFGKPGSPMAPGFGDAFHNSDWKDENGNHAHTGTLQALDVFPHPTKPGLHYVGSEVECKRCGGAGTLPYDKL